MIFTQHLLGKGEYIDRDGKVDMEVSMPEVDMEEGRLNALVAALTKATDFHERRLLSIGECGLDHLEGGSVEVKSEPFIFFRKTSS